MLNVKKKMASARPRKQAMVINVISMAFRTTRWISLRSVSTGIAPDFINDSAFSNEEIVLPNQING